MHIRESLSESEKENVMKNLKSVVSLVVRKALGLPPKNAKCCGPAPERTKEEPREVKKVECC